MLASATSFAFMAASAKMMPEIPALEKVFVRSLISVVLTVGAMARAKVSLRPSRPGLLAMRAAFGFAGLWCYFEAIARLPLGNAVTAYNTTPLFAAVVGALVFGERLRGVQVFSLFLGLAGIAVMQGVVSLSPSVGILFALGTALFSSVAYSLIRVLVRTEHPLRIVLAFPLLSIPVAWMLGGRDFVLPQGHAWIWLLLLGVATQGGQVFLTYALRYHTATRATQIGFLGVVLAMLIGVPHGDGWPGWAQIGGASLVFLSLTLGGRRSSTG